MAVLVTIHIKYGIVMASDSRLVKRADNQNAITNSENPSLIFLDTGTNVFLTPSGTAIGQCGEPSIDGILVEDLLKQFLINSNKNNETHPSHIADSLLRFFRKFQPYPDVTLHVAGYTEDRHQQVLCVDVQTNSITLSSASDRAGIVFDGEADAVMKLIYPLGRLDEQKQFQLTPHFDLAWSTYSVQDAIDLAIFLVQAQINLVQFQSRLKSVGGPIDVLVIQPDRAFWTQKKS